MVLVSVPHTSSHLCMYYWLKPKCHKQKEDFILIWLFDLGKQASNTVITNKEMDDLSPYEEMASAPVQFSLLLSHHPHHRYEYYVTKSEKRFLCKSQIQHVQLYM